MAKQIHIHIGTKDATPEEDFKSRVAEINRLLTDASRKAAGLASLVKDGTLRAKAETLEEKIDEARRYAFSIR